MGDLPSSGRRAIVALNFLYEPGVPGGLRRRMTVTMAKDADAARLQSYLLAVEDKAFLRRDELRPLRLALEFEKFDLLLKEMGIGSTIVVFGSSRILSPEEADERLRVARGEADEAQAKREKRHSVWYEEARTFARIVSERGGSLSPVDGIRENVIVTGGGPGIMEAANRGAAEAGAPNIGFNILLPEELAIEEGPNAFSTPELTCLFRYFAIRKMHFAIRANALAIFPGGFGTMDELFEILTLKQTRKTPLMPVILFCRSYWKEMVNFEKLADLGMIAPEDLGLFDVVDTAEEAWDVIVKRGLMPKTPLKED